MARIEGRLRTDVPAELAYELWSTGEELPNFMGAVTQVTASGSGQFEVEIENDGSTESRTIEFDTSSARSLRWRSVAGGRFLGEVTLRTAGEGCDVMLVVDYEPNRAADPEAPRVVPMWDVGGDLLRFKMYAEGVLDERHEPAALVG